MRASAPLLSDQPASEDLLGHDVYCRALRDVVTSPATETPLVLGVFGAPGSGKTTLLRGLERELRMDGVATVWCSAALYDQEDETWAAFPQSLLAKLAGEVGLARRLGLAAAAARSTLDWPRLARALLRVAGLALVVIAPLVAAGALFGHRADAAPFDAVHVGAWLMSAVLAGVLFVKPAADAVRDRVSLDLALHRAPDHEYHVAFMDRARDHFARVVATLPAVNGKRLVVLVDDLDRCAAPRAIEILHALELFADVRGCVFVLGADAAAAQCASTRPSDDAARQAAYLGRIVQLSFHLPPLGGSAATEYLQRLGVGLPDERCRDVLASAPGASPREIKRIVNAFSLLWHIASAERGDERDVVTPVRLAKVVVIQHAFPALHATLSERPALLADLERHFRHGASAAAPPALAAFVADRALERLLTLHVARDAAPSGADDASFASLGADDVGRHYALARLLAPLPDESAEREEPIERDEPAAHAESSDAETDSSPDVDARAAMASAPHAAPDIALLWRSVGNAVRGTYELLSEIGSADGRTAFLAREAASGDLRVLLLEPSGARDGDGLSLSAVPALDGSVPAPPALACASCGVADGHWWPRCPRCGADAAIAASVPPAAVVALTSAQLGRRVELLGEMPHAAGGRLYFGRDPATGCVSALEIVAGESTPWRVRSVPLPCPPATDDVRGVEPVARAD